MAKIDEEIKRLCEEKGLAFKPWEFPPPWDVSEATHWANGLPIEGDWWPKAQAMRRELIAEIKQRRATAKGKTK